MKMRICAGLILLASLTAASSAVVFGSPVVTGTVDGQVSFIGSNAINFSLGDFTVRGSDPSKMVNISFNVQADAGMMITGYTIGPVGFVRSGATANIDATSTNASPFNQVDNYNVTDLGFKTFPNQSYALSSPQGLLAVNLAATLTSLANQSPTSVASMTQLTVIYSEAPAVPEPASMGALGIGLVGLISRRSKNRKGGLR